MFIKLKDKYETPGTVEYIFETHLENVLIRYNKADYDTIKNDPQMDVDLHAFMRCASKMQSRCTITRTQGNA